jgi:DNA-binding transcriptional LysR family regulator
LEDWTGTKLVNRTAGGAVLTEQGAKYHQQIAVAIDDIANATIDLMKTGDNHCIDIWCMPGFAVQWLMERLESYESCNPDIAVALRPTEDVPDFDRQEADIDIRFDAEYGASFKSNRSMRAIKLASPPIIPVASPEYLARAQRVEAPIDLLKHQLLHEENFDDWGLWLRAHGVEFDFDLSGLRLFNGHMTLDAARRGRGIALTNHYVVNKDLKAGHLVELEGVTVPFEHLTMGSYMFVAKRDRWNVRPIRRFREWIQAEIAKETPASS